MLIIPAIDIQDGQVVRLAQGDFSKKVIYSSNPVEVAKRWQEFGFKRLHIVDLDGAREGVPVNKEVIKEIARELHIEVEVGGGIRDQQVISEYLDSGVNYLILGTAAFLNPKWFKDLLKDYAGRLLLALDMRDGSLRIKGWQKPLNIDVLSYLEEFVKAGLDSLIYTDITRDGTLKGVNIFGLQRFLEMIRDLDVKVIVSGGISSMEDLKGIKELNDPRIFGAIIGKAFYEGKIDPSSFKEGKL
jgi:phosphoribosylformimino-5-aminoimidazole carboxamide ribotide isomerase